MHIEIIVKFKTDKDIRDYFSSYSDEYKKEAIADNIETNNVLISVIDMEAFKFSILQEFMHQFEPTSVTTLEEYDFVELLLKYKDQLPKKIMDGLLSDYSSEIIESIFPDFSLEIIREPKQCL